VWPNLNIPQFANANQGFVKYNNHFIIYIDKFKKKINKSKIYIFKLIFFKKKKKIHNKYKLIIRKKITDVIQHLSCKAMINQIFIMVEKVLTFNLINIK